MGSTVLSFVHETPPTNAATAIYTLIVVYDKGTANTTAKVTLPSRECPLKDGSFCLNPATVVECENYVPTKATCRTSAGEVCGMRNGRAACIKQANCKECNGLFDMYPDGTVPLTEGTPEYQTTCSESLTCYRDLGATAVELYKECKNLHSCASYRTKAACEENQCERAGDCTWRVIDQGTGRGVCGAVRPEIAPLNCADCNTLDGGCDAETCSVIGQTSPNTPSACVFIPPPAQQQGTASPDGMPRVFPPGNAFGCRQSRETVCELLTTQQSCEGGQAYVLDTQYGNGVRRGGTNTRTTRSNDAAGLGVCVWMGGACRKDADKDGTADWRQYPETADVWNLSLDVTPPTTSVFGTPGAVFPADFSVSFTNTSTAFVCFSKKGENCYPDTQEHITGQTIKRFFEASESAEWELRYFGVDSARNLETVKVFPFRIDGEGPVITIVNESITQLFVYQTAASSAIRTRAAITFTVSEPSRCTTSLVDGAGSTVSATMRGGANTDLNQAYGERFIVEYPALADGQFEMRITCTDLGGNRATLSRTIIADSDRFLFDPRPADLGNPLINSTVQVEIRSSKAATCRYGEESASEESTFTLWSRFTPYNETGNLVHRATVSTPQSRKYAYLTVCNVTGTLTRGSIADYIVFGIDRAAPTTSICAADSEDECQPVRFSGTGGTTATSGASGAQTSYRLKLLCNDLPTGSPSFGCTPKSTSHCVYREGDTPCQLKQGSVTNAITGTTPFIIRYSSTDRGGNSEGVREQRIELKDTTPPRAPSFTISP
jgi:hypothetical protein